MGDSKKRTPQQQPQDPLLRELVAIKRLLILQLMKDGIEAKDIALVLGIDNSDLSRIIPKRQLTSLRKAG